MADGLATGTKVLAALSRVGINVTGYRWQWRPGLQGGIFGPHYQLRGKFASDQTGFDYHWPRADLNGDYCMCDTRFVFRDERGRFARP